MRITFKNIAHHGAATDPRTPLREPRFDARALGLDTGCVYGGSLTGAILENGERRTVSVPANRH